MKFIILSVLVVLVGCDTPTRSRFPSSGSIGNPITVPGNTPMVPITPTPVTPTPATPAPAGFENCNITKRAGSADIGNVGACKSTLDETVVRFVASLSNLDSSVCIFPTNSGRYLGEPQCTLVNAEQIYNGRLYKNRPGYSALPITGLAIMKMGLLPDYLNCQRAYDSHIARFCPANPAACAQTAAAESNYYCSLFTQKYPNNVVYISL